MTHRRTVYRFWEGTASVGWGKTLGVGVLKGHGFPAVP
jgi:hypothetical protein